MKNLILLLPLLLSLQSLGQSKINFADTSNRWLNVSRTITPGSIPRENYHYHQYYYGTDTIINSNTYHELRSYYVSWKIARREGFVRYDTSSNKVYMIVYGNEVLLYDFNLTIGDTVFCPLSSTYQNMNYTVVNIDTVLINNAEHKRFSLKVTDSSIVDMFSQTASVIEGIGCTTGPLDLLTGDQLIVNTGEVSRHLSCFMNNGISPYPYFQNCPSHLMGVDNISEFASGITQPLVYPQPATTLANIQLAETIKTGTLYLFNQYGQMLYREIIHDKVDITVNAPATPGLYYYCITNNTTGKVWQGKLLFE